MRRVPFIVLALAFLFSLPAGAQIAGRWKLILDNGHGTVIQGELRLADSGAAGGRVLLESRDSAWIPLRGPRVDDSGTITFSVAAGDQLQFEGRLVGAELEGTVAVQGDRRYRWRGVRLRPEEEYYAALPRFRQLQVRIESRRTDIVLPGRWLAAATALQENPAAIRSGYTERSLHAGLVPLPPDSLTQLGLIRAMGLFRRDEMARAAQTTLEKIRAQLVTDSARTRFDFLFRPGGHWQLDLHDVALARARRPFPTLTWESVRPALAAAGLLDNDRPDVAVIPLALYRLYAQSRNDTSAYRAAQARLRQADATGAALLTSLVNSYEEASGWYASVMSFLLEHRWIPGGAAPRSPAELVRAAWGDGGPVPTIRSRPFGYPEGTVRIGTDSTLAGLLIRPENASARDWISRHGMAGLITALHRLSVPYGERTGFRSGDRAYRLSSVQEYARESFSGFLEPEDLILLDPSYQPLLALGTLIHEWQHILQERARQRDPRSGAYRVIGDQLVVTQFDPFLAEGLAEWLTEEILAPALTDFPLIGFGEMEKRASLPQNDPHQLGYLLVRALARTLNNVGGTRRLLVQSAADPFLVVRDARLVRAWAAHRGADRTMTRRPEPALLPLAVFTIEDGEPDLVQSQIIAPYISPP